MREAKAETNGIIEKIYEDLVSAELTFTFKKKLEYDFHSTVTDNYQDRKRRTAVRRVPGSFLVYYTINFIKDQNTFSWMNVI